MKKLLNFFLLMLILTNVAFAASGVSTATQYLGEVATANKVCNYGAAGTAVRMFRTRHYARSAINSNLQIMYPNWYIASPDTETAGGSTMAIKAAIEYPAGVTSTAVTWSGSSSVSITSGNNSPLSDPIPVNIPNGAVYFVRTLMTPSTTIVLQNSGTLNTQTGAFDSANGEGSRYSASDETASTGVLSSGNADIYDIYGPIVQVAPTSNPSVLIIGDSRQMGIHPAADSDPYTGTSGDKGELPRSIGPFYAYTNVGREGASEANFVSSHTKRVALAVYFTHVIDGYGVNDATAGTSAATMLSNAETVAGYFSTKVFRTTIVPHTSSTDSWATVGNQTYTSPGTTTMITFNDSIRTSPSQFTGYFDLDSVLESAIDSGYWAVNGTANLYTTDGLHDNQGGNLFIQSSGIVNPQRIVR